MQRSLLSGFAILLGLTVSTAQAAPNVVASIKPVHSLVESVMGSVGTPHLILDGAASPHGFAMKPSDAGALSKADLVFWIGPDLEQFLVKPVNTLANPAGSVPLMNAPGLALLPYRSGGLWGAHDHEDDDHHGSMDHKHGDGDGHDHEHEAGAPDPHVWLDPANARAMVDAIATALADLDPANASAYLANADRMNTALTALETELDRTLAPVRDVPYIVFHDGFQYLEHRYWLTGAGAITINPEVAPGAARLSEIQDHIRKSGATCVFSEPQFQPRVIQVVIEGTGARTGVIDPLGADLESGSDLYARMMQRNAERIRTCLSPK